MPETPPTITYAELWTAGMNSMLYPTNSGQGAYVWGENIMIRGGIPQTRLGLNLHLSIPGTLLQGLTFFRPLNGIPVLVFAIDGLIYYSKWPYQVYAQIQGIQFSSISEQIVMTQCVKSARRNPDGTITVVPAFNVLVMQDGSTKAAFWDGTTGRHLDPSAAGLETPVGLWQAWAGNRLWVAFGNQVFASDIDDPLSFSERVYISQRDGFAFSTDVSGMIESSDKQGLLVFTINDVSTLQSSIQDRTQWSGTTNFQQFLIPGVGCIAGKTILNQFGSTWWLSRDGWIDLNSALFTLRNSQLVVRDNEMMQSKRKISPTAYLSCAVAFSNMLGLSVPSGSLRNAHTWILDHAVATTLGGSAPDAWASVWSGFQPVEWATSEVVGINRCFAGCQDATAYQQNYIHIWEAFLDERTDNGNRIGCQFQTGLKLMQGMSRFMYAKLDLIEIIGDVVLNVYLYGTKGGFTQIYHGLLQAEIGSPGSINQTLYSSDTIFQTFAPQTRTIFTDRPSPQSEAQGDVNQESDRPPEVDYAFGVLVQWSGRMAIRGISLFTKTEPDEKGRNGQDDESADHRIINEEGQSISASPVSPPIDPLDLVSDDSGATVQDDSGFSVTQDNP